MGRGQGCMDSPPPLRILCAKCQQHGVVPHDRTVGERLKGGESRKLWSILGRQHPPLSTAPSLLRPEDARSVQVGSGERAQEQSRSFPAEETASLKVEKEKALRKLTSPPSG